VNGQFEAISGVYAAGGAASYYDAALGRRRIDRYDHSVNSGLLAGYNMAASLASARTQFSEQVRTTILPLLLLLSITTLTAKIVYYCADSAAVDGGSTAMLLLPVYRHVRFMQQGL
jgi:hypothetical protein